MSIQAAQLFALVGVQGAQQSVRDLNSVSSAVNKTQGTLNRLSKNAGQVGHGMLQVGSGLLRIAEIAGVAALGAVAASGKIGTTFQQQMELIHTQAGATQAEVIAQTKAVQDMVHEVGTTPDALARGLYHIESVGVRGAKALDILKASALGAKVGLADMETVSNALTAVSFSTIDGVKNMTEAMGTLNAIVGVGNMRLQDLVDSFSTGILGTAKTFGVSLQSVGAALAVLSDAGVPAQVAATRLSMTFTHMAAPVVGAQKVLKRLGMDQFALARDLRKPDGLDAALLDLGKHLQAVGEMNAAGVLTPQGTADVAKIFGGSRFGATAMQLLANVMAPVEKGGDRVKLKYDQIIAQQSTFGEKVKATMETAGFTFGQLRADIEESALAFSDGFLPALARAGTKLDTFLVGHLGDIRTMGVELGAWIDKIDWGSVEKGANSFVDVLKEILDIISKVPPQVDLAIVGFLGLNKLSGGLLGKGVENIVGGAIGGVGTIGGAILRMGAGKLGVGGGLAAALTSTPVYITGIAPGVGFGMGGVPSVIPAGAGLAGGLGASAGMAGLGTLLPLALPFLALLIPAAVRGLDEEWTRTHPNVTHGLMSPKGGQSALSGIEPSTPGRGLFAGLHDAFAAASGHASITVGGFDARVKESDITLGGFDKRITAASNAMAGLGKHLTATLGLTAKEMLAGIEKRSMEKYGWKSGKPPESWVMGTFGRNLLKTEQSILHGNMTATDQLKALQRLQRTAIEGKDWGVARKLKADIAALKTKLSHDVRVTNQQVAFAIRDKEFNANLTAHVNLKVDGQDLANALIRSHQFGRILD